MMNIENNNVTVKEWKKDFAEIISRQTGFPLNAENIFSDEKDWEFYITKNSLQDNSPLLLMNYMGELIAIIPEKEYQKLDSRKIWPFEYIPAVRWYYGQYLDNMDWPTNVFWQPIEKRPGINDKKKVSRYLNILKCRVDFYRTAKMPTDETCASCNIEKCPFSMLNSKKEDSDWNNEIQEHDYRDELFDAIKERIKNELELEVVKCSYYTGTRALLVMPSKYCQTTKDYVEVFLPIKMLNYLMYNPVYRNWQQYAKSFLFELGVEGKEKRVVVPNDQQNVAQYCREMFERLWTEQPVKKEEVVVETQSENKESFENVDEEFISQQNEEDVSDREKGKNEKTGIFKSIKNFFFGNQ